MQTNFFITSRRCFDCYGYSICKALCHGTGSDLFPYAIQAFFFKRIPATLESFRAIHVGRRCLLLLVILPDFKSPVVRFRSFSVGWLVGWLVVFRIYVTLAVFQP